VIDKDTAKKLVEAQLENWSSGGGLVVVDENTMETEFGWVFFYDSKEYLETEDLRYAIAGNAPIVVLKKDGSLRVTGTAQPIELYLDKLAQELQATRTG